MKVEVTIIIAAYNAEATIERALKSVKSQNFENWECLIIDGASKDKTIEIVQKIIKSDSRFQLFSEPDKGVYDAFNKGWRLAHGEWIYYLGADDELLPNGLSVLISKSDGVDLVYGGIVRRYANGKTKQVPPDNFEYCMPFSLGASHQTIIMKRNLIEKLGGFKLKYRILADFDLINNAYYVGIKTRRCDNCIAIFQIGGLSTDNLSSLKERFDILTSYAVPKEKAFLHCLKMGILFCLYKIKHRYF